MPSFNGLMPVGRAFLDQRPDPGRHPARQRLDDGWRHDGGSGARDTELHEPRAGPWLRSRSANRHLFVRRSLVCIRAPFFPPAARRRGNGKAQGSLHAAAESRPRFGDRTVGVARGRALHGAQQDALAVPVEEQLGREAQDLMVASVQPHQVPLRLGAAQRVEQGPRRTGAQAAMPAPAVVDLVHLAGFDGGLQRTHVGIERGALPRGIGPLGKGGGRIARGWVGAGIAGSYRLRIATRSQAKSTSAFRRSLRRNARSRSAS